MAAILARHASRNVTERVFVRSTSLRRNAYSTQPRVAIVGSGPAGFYAARRLMLRHENVHVDMYEQLPVPFGLVRYGVAPDHPEVKNCEDTFNEVAASTRFNFIGNTKVGLDVPLQTLRQYYDSLLFAYGTSHDRLLGIPGEDLKGVYSAREFVGWYNGLPEFQHLRPNLDSDTAVVIGNGNVALDVARILLTSVDSLKKTDISTIALDHLSRSRVRNVIVAGRRGPMQAAFTIKELRELLTLPNTGFHFEAPDLAPDADYISKLPRLEQRKYRFADLLRRGSSTPYDAARKTWSLLSMVSPIDFSASQDQSSLTGVDFEKAEFVDDGEKYSKTARTTSTDQKVHVPTNLAFRSIGYKSSMLPGLATIQVGFDSRKGVIHNDGLGRALDKTRGSTVKGMYCTGWVKNGPTGVIASTMEDAFTCADAMLRDLEIDEQDTTKDLKLGFDALKSDPGVNLNKPVNWAQWKVIDAAERQRGKDEGKIRTKFTNVADMLNVIYPEV